MVTSVAAVLAHALGVLTIIGVSLLWNDSLPQQGVQAFFAAPLTLAPPPPPPPPLRAAARPAPRAAVAAKQQAQLVAPVAEPNAIVPEQSLDLGDPGGLPGGVEGGVPGGVVGGVVGGLPDAPPPPPPRRTLRAGVDVREPRKTRDAAPVYPDLAVLSHLQGVVILDCTIDTHGRVSDVRVLRGVPMLNEAAMAAVRQWLYTPTLVNGVPMPVVMNVTVSFRLQDALGPR